MTWIVGDIARVTLRSQLLGEVFYNIFHYRISNIIDAANINNGFNVSMQKYIITPMRPLFSLSMSYTQVKVENLSQPNRPFFEFPISIAGTAGTESAPTFVAYQYKLIVGTRKTRAGYKRFGGVTEGAFNGNSWASSFLSTAQGITTGLGASMTLESPSNTVVGTAQPIVLKNIGNAIPTANDWQDVLFADFIDRPTTQGTRKVRGV